MESAFLAFWAIFVLLSIFFAPIIFSYMALPYIILILIAMATLRNSFLPCIPLTLIIFFIAFFFEIRLSNISFTVNQPLLFTRDDKEDHEKIKRLIIVHYVIILYVFIVLSYYAYQGITVK